MTGPGKISRRALALAGLGTAAAAALAPASAAPRSRNASIKSEDRAAITDLFTRYVWAYDCTDEVEFLTLFTDDALVVGKGTVYRGKPAILGWFRTLIAMREREGDDTWMHEAGQFRFEPAGRGCIVYAYATHFNGNSAKALRGVRSLGYFTCEGVKQDGEWRFRRFSISTWDRTKVPWKKPLPWADFPAA
ncbi:nuclear transport factor 2 family protein [Novosphingobium aquae]|uniref:Nuclear transport factor 2 family protein n=1 Tax=Novosphingobium aquae TaxID=3133435 RepID=A0ABU8SEX9_9SPHN